MRNSHLVGLFGTALVLLLSAAQPMDSGRLLGTQGFTRDFGGRTVRCDISARAAGVFAPGQRITLQVDLDSSIAGGTDEEYASAVVLNGLAAIALPPGLEPDGQLRLYYFDENRGSYQFMYSKDYPALDRLTGLDGALQQAQSKDPKTIFTGLADISRALDPALTPAGPLDSRVIGANASYAVSGVSWLIPCNVYFNALVDPFDPASSLGRVAKLRISLPLKVTQAAAEPRIVIYAGGLSTAVVKTELPADKLPATALPLVPLEPAPATDAAPAAEQQPASGGEDAGAQPRRTPPDDTRDRGGAGRAGGTGRSLPIMRPEGQDEAPPTPPAPSAEAAAAPPAPAPLIPALIYSYEWVAWENEVDLSALSAGAAATAPTPVKANNFAMPDAQDVAAAGGDTTEPAGESQPAQDDTPTPELKPAPELKRPQGRELPPADAGQTSPVETGAEPPAKSDSTPKLEDQDSSGVREVKPGTLGDSPQVYSVPLKEITGAGGTGTQQQPPSGWTPSGNGNQDPLPPSGGNQPPPQGLGEMVLIPEGYFLMGTGGAASAGDADEMPQTQVFLPAYYIDKYPVTNRQFMEYVLNAGVKPEGDWQKYFAEGSADLPVRGVTWNDAMGFARWAHKRLPTEAEWEKAARGEDGRTYPWGEDWSADILPRGEFIYDLLTATKTASPYGVMGMCGVMWQWTASPMAPYPFNPDARGEKYVLRGGCFSNGRNVVRCANRYAEPANVALNTFSFRCVKDAP